MPNPTKESVYPPLYLLLALTALGELSDGYWHVRGMAAPPLWEAVDMVMVSFTTFVWFCRDSDAHAYRRTRMRNIGLIFFSVFFIPVYIVRSRAAGQKWRALFRLGGFGILMLLAAALGLLLIAFFKAWL